MVTRKILLTATLLLLSIAATNAATIEQMKTTQSFDYSKFTYEWTDSLGVTHTAKLTDKATDPRQIMALLAEVYINDGIPGQHYAYSYGKTKEIPINYDAFAKSVRVPASDNWILNYFTGTIKQPSIDGKTALLIEVKDDATAAQAYDATHPTDGEVKISSLDWISRFFESVQLLDHNKYIPDATNPGYLFSIEKLNTNKFFFISKGKPRQFRVSDKRENQAGQATAQRPIYRLYEQLSPDGANGGEFLSTMKSGNVFFVGHDCWNVLAAGSRTKGHEFVISQTGEKYSLNNVTLYIPDRRFEGDRNSKGTGEYAYSYNQAAYKPRVLMYTCTQSDPTTEKVNNEEYQVNLKWSTSFDNAKLGLDVPQTYTIYTVDANGKRTFLATTDNIQNYSYNVPILNESYDITYLIVASPVQSNIEAESLTKTVTIPAGQTTLLVTGASYRSRYDMDSELNIYKNELHVSANSAEAFAGLSSVTGNYDVVRINPDATESAIAHVQFGGTADAVSYKVTYEDATQDLQHLFDSEVPATSGSLTSSTGKLSIIDRFTASTATNEQPTDYTYVLRYNGLARSNQYKVPVYKTASAVTLQSMTKDQADADVNHTLVPNQVVAITFEAVNNAAANIQQYTVYRDALADNTRSGKAEAVTGGYNVTDRAASGKLNATEGMVTIDAGGTADVTVTDYMPYATASKGFVPVITTYYNGDATMPNTYGCDIKNVALPSLKLTSSNVGRTKKWWAASGIYHAAYGATLTLTPSLPANIPNVYYYRLWRVDGGTETLLNGLDENIGNGWATTYASIKDFYPATDDATAVRDIYIAEDDGRTKTVDYIARMYSTIVPDASSAPARRVKAPTDLGYYISEDRITVKYSQETITGVADVEGAKQAVSVRYYNVAGQVSSTPFAGLNIERTTYSDGSVATRKVVK